MKFTEVVTISKFEQQKLQGILDIQEGFAEGYGKDEVIEIIGIPFTTPYGQYVADIKVCNGDTPYIDPVLFELVETDEGSHYEEVYPLEVEDTLLNSYVFENEENDQIFFLEAVIELEQ